jgi:hypothetical protein
LKYSIDSERDNFPITSQIAGTRSMSQVPNDQTNMKSMYCIMFSSVGHYTAEWESVSSLTLEYCLRKLNLCTILTDGETDDPLCPLHSTHTEFFPRVTHTSRASTLTHTHTQTHRLQSITRTKIQYMYVNTHKKNTILSVPNCSNPCLFI